MKQPSIHRRHGLLYATDPGRGRAWIFGSEGLLRSALLEDEKVKRGWDGRVQRVRLRPGTNPRPETVPADRIPELIGSLHREAETLFNDGGRERIPRWDRTRYRRARREFREVYGTVPILPPDQYRSLVFQLTVGCSHNRCRFCDFYTEDPYRVRSLETFRRHVEEVLNFFGSSRDYFTGVFLGAGDALSAPVDRLTEALRVLQGDPRLPTETICCFGQGNSARFKDNGHFERLNRAGLHRVYLGLETGSRRLLDRLNKPASPGGFRDTVRRLKAARIRVGCVVLLGVGGRDERREHERETLHLLDSLPLDRGDRLFLSPLPEGSVGWPADPGQEPKPLSRSEKDRQADVFRRRIQTNVPVALYDVGTFLW